MSNQVLLAVPYFVLMGAVLQRSRLAEDLLHTVGMLFGPRRGGLSVAVVFVCARLAAATGPNCASGTLGQIILPSMVLIVLGNRLAVSAGKLFRGALLPGLMLAGFYALYVALYASRNPVAAPALPPEEREVQGPTLLRRVAFVLVPPLALIVIVLGSIFMG